MDFALYVKKLNSMLDWSFVVNECLKYGINIVGTSAERAISSSWSKGEWANYHYHSEVGHVINLNPHINRIEVARVISETQGIKVAPDEVYYWLWFHEIGHATQKHFRNWKNAQMDYHFKKKGTSEDVARLYRKGEKAADRYANKRFLEWKAEGKMCRFAAAKKQPAA